MDLPRPLVLWHGENDEDASEDIEELSILFGSMRFIDVHIDLCRRRPWSTASIQASCAFSCKGWGLCVR